MKEIIQMTDNVPTEKDKEKLDQDLRDLGYDPVVIGKKGDALARLCYENQLNRAIIDAQKKHLDYCVQNHSKEALAAERKRVLESEEIKGLLEALEDVARSGCYQENKYLGIGACKKCEECIARTALANFEKMREEL